MSINFATPPFVLTELARKTGQPLVGIVGVIFALAVLMGNLILEYRLTLSELANKYGLKVKVAKGCAQIGDHVAPKRLPLKKIRITQ